MGNGIDLYIDYSKTISLIMTILEEQKEETVKKDNRTSADIIKERGLVYIKDRNVIIDKDDKEYKIEPHSLSLFTGAMIPINYGCMVDGKFIDIEDLKKE